MNKRITDATHEEIAQAMKNDAIGKIARKRKENVVKDYYNEELGLWDIYTKYQLENALKEDMGLEYRLYKSNERRKQRIKERMTRMFNTGQALFLTLTFSNKMFDRDCTTETRRTYIRRFLKDQCKEYVANIDFGEKNKREHYHAVVVPKTTIDFAKYREIFDSNINAKHIYVDEMSLKLVGRYINKLTNHALKENGFYKRLIFSRNR